MEGERMTAVTKKNYPGIDYFRIIAAVLVVAIHTSPLLGINETADFILTRIIGRVAVPFFFMTSGFLLFARAKEGQLPFSRLSKFLKKTLVLYAVAILVYLPLNIYTGTLLEWDLASFVKALVFDGTFYHLWYLPAVMLAALITWIMLRFLQPTVAFSIGILLYLIGLFGDSYYGFIAETPFFESIYQHIFQISSYTRNGLFFAPIFFLLGASLVRMKKEISFKASLIGVLIFFILMLSEGLWLHSLGVQRHDSMYIMLLPCMLFLFQALLFWQGKSYVYFRDLSMLIYLIHPAIIVVVRGVAQATGLQNLLIDHNLIHFIAVTVGSIAVSVILGWFWQRGGNSS